MPHNHKGLKEQKGDENNLFGIHSTVPKPVDRCFQVLKAVAKDKYIHTLLTHNVTRTSLERPQNVMDVSRTF